MQVEDVLYKQILVWSTQNGRLRDFDILRGPQELLESLKDTWKKDIYCTLSCKKPIEAFVAIGRGGRTTKERRMDTPLPFHSFKLFLFLAPQSLEEKNSALCRSLLIFPAPDRPEGPGHFAKDTTKTTNKITSCPGRKESGLYIKYRKQGKKKRTGRKENEKTKASHFLHTF